MGNMRKLKRNLKRRRKPPENIRVLFASYHCCARTKKEGIALLNQGIDVIFLQHHIADAGILPNLPLVSFYSDPDQYVQKLKAIYGYGIDLIHVHNEPDWLVPAAKRLYPDIPVVYECHDLNSQRHGKALPNEIEAMEVADGYIFPSQSYLDGATQYHNLDPNKPKAVIYSMCNEEVIVSEPLPRTRGIAYEGGIAAPLKDSSDEFFAYRNYIPVCEAFTAMGIPFAAYGVEERFFQAYLNAGAICFPPLRYMHFMKQLSRWDWGFCGPGLKHPQWDKAMPNKLFEYLAAGIPILVHNADECAEFVKKHNVGVVVDKLEDIPKVYNEHEEYRKIVREKRRRWTMECQTDKIIGLYGKVLG